MTDTIENAVDKLVARIEQLPIQRRLAIGLGLLWLTSALLFWAFNHYSNQRLINQEVTLIGHALARQTAQTVEEYVLSQDLVSLNVVARELVHARAIKSIAVFDASDNVLTRAGDSTPVDNPWLIRSPISFKDNQRIGYVDIEIDPDAVTAPLPGLHYRLLLLLAALLLVSALLYHTLLHLPARWQAIKAHRQQKSAEAATADRTEEAPGENTTLEQALVNHGTPRFLVRLRAVNQDKLAQRLTDQAFETLLDTYTSLLIRAAQLYNGSIEQGLAEQALVVFMEREDAHSDFFDTLCFTQLFLGLTRDLNQQRSQQDLPCLHFQALVYDAEDSPWESALDDSWSLLELNEDTCLFLSRLHLQTHQLEHKVVQAGSSSTPADLTVVTDLTGQYRQLINRQIHHLLLQAS